jgi:hypothetical protein
MTIETPATVPEGRALLKRYARLAARLASIVATRDQEIAFANQLADKRGAPIAAQLGEIETALKPWWIANAAEFTAGKRKSAELDGCVLGMRSSTAKLVVRDDDDDAAVERLRPLKWAADLLRTKISLERKAILSALGGKNAAKLAGLGFSASAASEEFFIKPAGQAGAAIEAKS